MTEVRRHHTCPVCELRFMVLFDDQDPLGEHAVKIECPPDDSHVKAWTPGIRRPRGPRLGARRMSRSVPFVPV